MLQAFLHASLQCRLLKLSLGGAISASTLDHLTLIHTLATCKPVEFHASVNTARVAPTPALIVEVLTQLLAQHAAALPPSGQGLAAPPGMPPPAQQLRAMASAYFHEALQRVGVENRAVLQDRCGLPGCL